MINVISFQPRNDFVLVRRIKQERTKEGIILPPGQHGVFAFGEVISVGAGEPTSAATRNVDDLKAGQIVMFQAGTAGNALQRRPATTNTLPFKIDNEELELLDERMIIGIVQTSGDS